MARIRTIKPEFPHSESMGRVSRESRLCFVLLWTIADDSGRLRGNSRMLASLLYPYDDDAKNKIDSWLGQLSKEGCIVRYEVEGTSYIQIENWSSHQKIDKPSPSKIPPFDESSRTFANPREASATDQDQGMDQGREGNGVEGIISVEPQSDSQLVISLKLIDKTDFNVTQDMLRDWQETFPAVDVMQELREMRNWCNVNAQKRKTRNGIAKFISTWLGKQQDRGGQALRKESALETPYQRSMRLRMQEAVPQIAAADPSIPAGDFFRTIEMVEVVR